MYLDEFRTLLARDALPNWTTAVDLPVAGQFTQTDFERRALGGEGGRRGCRRGIAVSDAPAALLDAVVPLLRLLDEPCERVTHPGDVTGIGRRVGYDKPSH